MKQKTSIFKQVLEKINLENGKRTKNEAHNLKESKPPLSKDLSSFEHSFKLPVINDRINVIYKMRELYFANPLAKNHARFYAAKVFGEGFSMHSPHIELEKRLHLAMSNIKDIKMLAEWLIVDGDIFLQLDTSVKGIIKPKYIGADEIIDIIYEDDVPKYYVRVYYDIASHTRSEEYIAADEMLHVSINKAPYSKFGISDLYASYTWIKMHEDVVIASAKKVELENAFAWHVSMNNATKEDISERVNIYNTKSFRDNLKQGGGIIVSNSKEQWQTLSRSNSSNVDETALRETKLMAIAGSALPEFIITGDAKNANLSSAQAQNMPFSIVVKSYQDVWREALLNYFRKVIAIEKSYSLIPRYVYERRTVLKSDLQKYKLFYKVTKVEDGSTSEYQTIEYKLPVEDATCNILFPDILSSDDKAEVEVLKMELDMGIVSRETVASKRGYNYKSENILTNGELNHGVS